MLPPSCTSPSHLPSNSDAEGQNWHVAPCSQERTDQDQSLSVRSCQSCTPKQAPKHLPETAMTEISAKAITAACLLPVLLTPPASNTCTGTGKHFLFSAASPPPAGAGASGSVSPLPGLPRPLAPRGLLARSYGSSGVPQAYHSRNAPLFPGSVAFFFIPAGDGRARAAFKTRNRLRVNHLASAKGLSQQYWPSTLPGRRSSCSPCAKWHLWPKVQCPCSIGHETPSVQARAACEQFAAEAPLHNSHTAASCTGAASFLARPAAL